MKCYGMGTLSEFLGDLVVYRNLCPLNHRLPTFADTRDALQLTNLSPPRKSNPEYGPVIYYLLRSARKLRRPQADIKRVIYIGDTEQNDVTAFGSICHAGRWPGMAFVASETDQDTQTEIIQNGNTVVCLANKWSSISEFSDLCQERQFAIDEHTAVLIDIDKTAIGARGRNDHVIDRVRVDAARRSIGAIVGEDFLEQHFLQAYRTLNQPQFHKFTTDNQDYLAYICLILACRLLTLESILDKIRSGELATFTQFLAYVDKHSSKLARHLCIVHNKVRHYVASGDPTPFKEFRRQEYELTVAEMGKLSADSVSVTRLLDEEIVITQELRRMALAYREQGALLFGLSDKPDEASIPNDRLTQTGALPIHQVKTHIVGE